MISRRASLRTEAMLARRRRSTLLLAAVLAGLSGWSPIAVAQPQPPASNGVATDSPLARSLGELIAAAIPPVYEKKADWGATKEIVVGVRTEGKGLRVKFHRRKKSVNHGEWKHYQLRLVDPDESLSVRLTRLQPHGPGGIAFEMSIDARVEAWGRLKIYRYGVHVIALETVADARVHLDVAGVAALNIKPTGADAGIALAPVITRAAVRFDEFALRRVSNAHGPLVHELGDAVRRWLVDAYDEATLTAKLNRAIEKKRDRLQLDWPDVSAIDWFATVPTSTPSE